MTSIDTKIEQLRLQLEAAEREKAETERRERDTIRRAMRDAGESHTRTVLALYELLSIEPEYPGTRTVKGQRRAVATDKAERVRSERLLTMIEAIVAEADTTLLDRLQREDERGRADRRPQRKVVEPVGVNNTPDIEAPTSSAGSYDVDRRSA